MNFPGKLIIISIITFLLISNANASEAIDDIMPKEDTKKISSSNENIKNSFIPKNFFNNMMHSDLLEHLKLLKNEELFRLNPYASYDANFKYKFDLSVYDRKLELVPKIRITRKLEDRISQTPDIEEKPQDIKNFSSVKTDPSKESLTNPSSISSRTNSIFVGMDLSYALNKSIFLDSNLSFYQTALEINDKDLKTKVEENSYRYEGNAMSVSIGLRKQLSDTFSAGLIYSWKKWLDETQDFGVDETIEENKASDESQKALNLMLRYDF